MIRNRRHYEDLAHLYNPNWGFAFLCIFWYFFVFTYFCAYFVPFLHRDLHFWADGVTQACWFFVQVQQITSGKSMLWVSFFLIRIIFSFKIQFLHRDLHLRFDGVTLTGCCFFPISKTRAGNWCVSVIFHHFCNFPVTPPPISRSWFVFFFVGLGGSAPPGPGTPPPKGYN